MDQEIAVLMGKSESLWAAEAKRAFINACHVVVV
jgi:hypothetical protein